MAGAQAPQSGIQATAASLALPAGIAFDSAGNLYLADLNHHVIREVNIAGIATIVAGTGEQGFSGDGGAATSALLESPAGVSIDGGGNIYIADTHNHRIRKVNGGTITTIAGTGVAGFSGDSGPAVSATLNHPTALALDSSGNLYITDTDNHRIRKITGTAISTVAEAANSFFQAMAQQQLLRDLILRTALQSTLQAISTSVTRATSAYELSVPPALSRRWPVTEAKPTQEMEEQPRARRSLGHEA